MPSPSLTVIDPSSDTNHEELARLVKLYDFPDFVKRADLQETMHPERVAISTFADPRNKMFKCHTAPATWLSALYFHEKKAEFHPKDRQRIQDRLEHYVDFFRIQGDYDNLVKQADDLHKEAELPDSSYAYLWVTPEGAKERHLRMTSAQEVKAAAEWLFSYQDRLPFYDRNTVARRILEKAAAFGADIDVFHTDFLEKQAGQGVCDPEDVYKMILQRSRLASIPAHKAELVKLAETIKDKPRIALQPDSLVKLAVTMDMADRAMGLKPSDYNEIIQRPEDVIFSATFTKVASARQELCALTTGNVYHREQFEKLSRDDVESLFGTDFASEVSSGLDVDGEKMAELAHTLPRPDAELLDRLMADAGLHPQMQKAASVGHGLSDDDLEALAAAYEVPSSTRA